MVASGLCDGRHFKDVIICDGLTSCYSTHHLSLLVLDHYKFGHQFKNKRIHLLLVIWKT